MVKQNTKILRNPDLQSTFGLSKSSIRNRILDGLIPPPISLGYRAVGWLESECLSVLSAMAAGKSKDQIKHLVLDLVKQRKESL